MADTSPDWITCGAAERLVNAITVGNKDHATAFCSLLSLAARGLVSVRAESAEFWETDDAAKPFDFKPFGIGAAIPFSPADGFFREASRRYKAGDDASGSFLTGSFSLLIHPDPDPKGLGRSKFTTFYQVDGLQFCRKDIIRHFGTAEALSSHDSSVSSPPNRRGRTKGSGSYARLDEPLLQEMHRQIASGRFLSAEAAARALAERAAGAGTPDSKKTRLAKAYRAAYPSAE